MNRTTQSLTALAVVAALATTMPAGAQIGGLKLPGVPGPLHQNAGASPDIDTFLLSTEQARELTRRSAVALLFAVAKHEDAVKIQEEQKAAEAITDPKEREAALSRVSDDASAQLAAVDYDAKSKELEASASAEQRKAVAVSVFNLALGILKDKDVVAQGAAITQSASRNPMGMAMQGGKLIRVKDAVGAVGGQMGNLGKIAVGMPKLMSAAKLQALPTSSSDKPMAVDIGG